MTLNLTGFNYLQKLFFMKLQIIRTMLVVFIVSLLFTIGCKKDSKSSNSNNTTNSSIKFNPNKTYGTVKDNEGNTYKTITIGTQTWMAENLKTKHYNNGEAIATTTPDTLDISSESNPKYQWAYNGNESNVSTYGRLYTWYAITDSRGVCPTGYHIPTGAEWSVLTAFLVDSLAGGKMKETGITHWQNPNTGANNSSGFSALPAGYRLYDDGSFNDLGYDANFWSSNEGAAFYAWFRYLYYDYAGEYHDDGSKGYGFSVRCLKD